MTPLSHNVARKLIENQICYLQEDVIKNNQENLIRAREAVESILDRIHKAEQEIRVLKESQYALEQLEG